MAESKKKKVAVVLSGGGADGAYEVGILKALCSGQSPTTNGEPLEPDIFAGTSIGSFNAAFLVSQWDRYGPASVSNLEKFWLENLAGGWHDNGVFRIRGNPRELLGVLSDPLKLAKDWLDDAGAMTWDAIQRGVAFAQDLQIDQPLEYRLPELVNLSSFISTQPMESMLQELDYKAIRTSEKWLKIAATNWATGELRIFYNHDMTDSFGPLAIRASASIPGFFPPVYYGSQPYCDGSVLLNTPLSPAIHAGADVLHVIYLDPDIKRIPLAHINNTSDTLLRMTQISWATAFNDDIGDAARINRGVNVFKERLQRDEAEGSRDVLRALADAGIRVDHRPLTIYRYHPQDPLEGPLGFLNFEPARIEALIERGFQDAFYHDFKESVDVFPASEDAPVNPRIKT